MNRTYLSFLAAVAVACGGGVGVEDLPDELTSKVCEGQVECGAFPDIATCEESGLFNIDIDGIQADIDAGIVSYDEDAARRCLDAYDALLTCELSFSNEAFIALQEACEAVFTGTVETGGACTESEQCAGAASCDEVACPDACCMGSCVADEPETLAEIGQSCADDDCVAGAYCVGDTELCAATVEIGGACADFDACDEPAICDFDLQTQMGTCLELNGEGGSCDPDVLFVQCLRTDNFCDPADSTCKARLEVGAACVGQQCVGFAGCVASVCTARPKLGEACEIDGQLRCLGSLDCVAGTCVAETSDPYCPLGG